MRLLIPTPRGFSFKRTVMSHGWCNLAPFTLDPNAPNAPNAWTLSRVLDIGDRAVRVEITGARGAVEASARGRIGRRDADRIVADVRRMFRLDDDLSGFYETVSREEGFEWIAREGMGRLLRAPTVFEDLVKTICTTNCSWALTRKMTTALVEHLGQKSSEGLRSFPTPDAMAKQPDGFYRDVVRAGYRAPYLKALAERVASGDITPETWLSNNLATDRLKRELKSIKGVGDYAAENLLRLLGRYDVLALDSWVRAEFGRARNGGRPPSDKKIARYYARFGEWRGLALWCDLSQTWLRDHGGVDS